MGGVSTQSLCGASRNCESHLRIPPSTPGGSPVLLPSVSHMLLLQTAPGCTVRGLPNDRFSAAGPRFFEPGNFDVCRPACWPELGPACTFLTLIASIHNHRSRRGEARRALEKQAGGSRGFDFQCSLSASWRVMPMAPIALWSQQSRQACGGGCPRRELWKRLCEAAAGGSRDVPQPC